MDKKIILWIVIGVLFVIALFLIFQFGATGNVAKSGKIDMTGWTENEIMNYEMHGTIPAGAGSSTSSSSGGMVGGC